MARSVKLKRCWRWLTGMLKSPDERKGRMGMHVAAQYGHVSSLISYLAFGVDIYATDNEKDTPLHYAARYGHTECVALLLATARVTEAEDTARATANGASTATVKRLVNMQNAAGFTALHYAVYAGHLEIVQLLLSEGASICLHNTKLSTSSWLKGVPLRSNPLHLAAAKGYVFIAKAIVQAYLDRPSDIRAPDPRLLRDMNGLQPYMIAGNNSHWFCAQVLLLVSRDETHAYWERYMQLSPAHGEESRVKVPSLISVAHKAWMQQLEQQLDHISQLVDSSSDGRQAADVQSHVSDQAPGSRLPSESGHASSKVHHSVLQEQRMSEAGDDRVCGVCFERVALVGMTSCQHALCASCSKRVVAMEAVRMKNPPKCPFCQQAITGFAHRPC